MKEFKNWHDIQDWCRENGFDRITDRMQLNNDCWMSSGEFGRSQVHICDSLRFAYDEDDRIRVAELLEEELKDDIVLDIVGENK